MKTPVPSRRLHDQDACAEMKKTQQCPKPHELCNSRLDTIPEQLKNGTYSMLKYVVIIVLLRRGLSPSQASRVAYVAKSSTGKIQGLRAYPLYVKNC